MRILSPTASMPVMAASTMSAVALEVSVEHLEAARTTLETLQDQLASNTPSMQLLSDIAPIYQILENSEVFSGQVGLLDGLRKLLAGPQGETAGADHMARIALKGIEQGLRFQLEQLTSGSDNAVAERILGQVKAKRVRVAVGFADISGFSSMVEREDPELVASRLNQYFAELEKVIKELGGEIDKYIGDEIMFYFVDYADNAARAVQAALAMQQVMETIYERLGDKEEIRFRHLSTGINVGEVVLSEIGGKETKALTAIGSTVNLAKRFEGEAPKGGVAIGAGVMEAVEPFFDMVSLGPVTLKGSTEPQPVFLVKGRKPTLQYLLPASESDIEFRGRADQVEQLRESFRKMGDELQTMYAGVEGHAGQGKSRLVDEFIRWVRSDYEGTDIIIARGQGMAAMAPNHVLIEAIKARAGLLPSDDDDLREARLRGLARDAFPGTSSAEYEEKVHLLAHFLGVLISDPASEEVKKRLRLILGSQDLWRETINDLVIELFDGLSQRQPVVLVLDDLQWVDMSSQRLIHAALEKLSDSRLMVVSTKRIEDDSGPDTDLKEKPVDWYAGGFTAQKIDLGQVPLSDTDALAMVDEILGDPFHKEKKRLIVQSAKGSPFWLRQTSRNIKNEGWDIRYDEGRQLIVMDSEGQSDIEPRTVDQLQARLQRLDKTKPELATILDLAAVIGRDFAVMELFAFGEFENLDTDALTSMLDNLVGKDFLTRNPSGRYQYTHDLMRTSAYRRIADQNKTILHAQYAIAMEVEEESIDLAFMASHFERAGLNDKAAKYYFEAAEAEFKSAGLEGVAPFYAKAFQLTDDTSTKLRYLRGWDEAAYLKWNPEMLTHIHQLANDLIDNESDISVLDQAGWLMRVGRVSIRSYKFQDAEPLLERAQHLLQDQIGEQAEKLMAAIIFEQALILTRQQKDYTSGQEAFEAVMKTARKYFEAVMETARKYNDTILRGRAYHGMAQVWIGLGDYSKAIKSTNEAVKLFLAMEEPAVSRAIVALTSAGHSLVSCGKLQEAESILRDGDKLVEQMRGKSMGQDYLRFNLGRSLYLQGIQEQTHEARDNIFHAIRFLESNLKEYPNSSTVLANMVYLSLAKFENGQHEQADEIAGQALHLASNPVVAGDQQSAADDEGFRNEGLAMTYTVMAQLTCANALNESDERIRESKLQQALVMIENSRKAYKKPIDEFEIEAQRHYLHALIVKELEGYNAALPFIQRAQDAVDRLADNFNESDREIFLSMKVHRDINTLLKKAQAATLERMHPAMMPHLERLSFDHFDRELPERFSVNDAVRAGDVVREIDDTGNVVIVTSRGLVSQSTADIMRWFGYASIAIDEVPGEFKWVKATDLKIRTVWDRDGKMYILLDWKLGVSFDDFLRFIFSGPFGEIMQRLIDLIPEQAFTLASALFMKFALAIAGRAKNGRYTEALQADIYEKDGINHIDLKRFDGNAIITESNDRIDIDSELRPTSDQFSNRLVFRIIPLSDDQSLMAMSAARTLFTPFTKPFLTAILDQLMDSADR